MCHRLLLARLKLFLGDFHSIVLYQTNAIFVAQLVGYIYWNIQMSVLNMQWLETLSCIIALSVVCRWNTLSFSVDPKFRLTLLTNIDVWSAWQLLLSFALNLVCLVLWLVFICENEVKYIDLCQLIVSWNWKKEWQFLSTAFLCLFSSLLSHLYIMLKKENNKANINRQATQIM